MKHHPVLLEEILRELRLEPDSVVIDCTLGAGGYASAIIDTLDDTGLYIGLDADENAVNDFKKQQPENENVRLLHENFANIKQVVSDLGRQPDVIVADLGWRSEQFSEGGKGFSFQVDEPLIMTYGDPAAYPFTAYDVVNEWEESSIADVLYGYGEERQSRCIAKAIVKERSIKPITSSVALARIVAQALPAFRRRQKIHPATKTFQALRITVNDELGALNTLLRDGFECLLSGGSLAIVSFHSLEDRIVKNFFKEKVRAQAGTLPFKKPIVASKEELQANPRSRSAKLRIIKKL